MLETLQPNRLQLLLSVVFVSRFQNPSAFAGVVLLDLVFDGLLVGHFGIHFVALWQVAHRSTRCFS